MVLLSYFLVQLALVVYRFQFHRHLRGEKMPGNSESLLPAPDILEISQVSRHSPLG